MHISDQPDVTRAIFKVREALADTNPGVYILTFGCQQNEADSEKLYGMAMQMGYSRTSTPDDADLILVNTCAIREHAELKALSMIGECKHIKARRPRCILGVLGCMAAEAHRVEDLKRKYPYVDFTLEPSAMHLLPTVLQKLLTKKKRLFIREEDPGVAVEGMPVFRSSPHRAWVSIMYGCNNFCSYCIVPYVRHRERSRDASHVEAEVKELIENGVHDITLLGQNVNSFRGGCDFTELLTRLDKNNGDFLLRFMTSHPKDASLDLIDAMAESKHVAPHLHLPLQSGSDKVLFAMNRHYDLGRYMQVVDRFKDHLPHAALTSDIIVGFPGETEEDFLATLDVLRRVEYDLVYAFLYSPRKGTPAASMENQIPEEVKHERLSRLLALQDEISLKKNQAYVGKEVRVLVDSLSRAGKERIYNARTDSGKLVLLGGDDTLIGTYQTVRIDRAEPYTLRATLTH